MADPYGGEGFEAFVEGEIPRLLGLATLITRNPHDARDLVQESLVRVGSRWRRLDRTEDPHAYAQRVLLNLNVSNWRKLRRELPLAHRREDEFMMDSSDTDLVELNQVLLPALRGLPPRHRAVIALRYFEGLTEAETAVRMGCVVGTVKSQHAKAIAGLRERLGSDPGAQNPMSSGREV